MKIIVNQNSWVEQSCDLLVVGCPESETVPELSSILDQLPDSLRNVLQSTARDERFRGREQTTLALHTHGTIGPRRLLLVGLGKGELTATGLQKLARTALQHAGKRRATSAAFLIPGLNSRHARALSCAIMVADYRFDRYKNHEDEPPATIERVEILGLDGDLERLSADAEAGALIGRSVNFARDLVNEPGSVADPEHLAEAARKIAASQRLDCRILDRQQIADENMNLFLAVAMGSEKPPRFIHLTYMPENATSDTPSVALVGKGITFDSGGLSLKPAASMDEMKMDMGGAAAVLGTMSYIRQLGPDCIVHGIVPTAENMPSAASFRPGDIFRGRSGKTVEVLNTDAEGRLILADALSYAGDLNPTAIIDLATLTGACCVALGNHMAGMFSDDEALVQAVSAAAQAGGEDLWRLPLSKRLNEQLKSDVADLKNIGDRWGGAITAALFLQAFAGEHRWMHLDIAGPAFASKGDSFHPKGGTGYGVRTLLEFVGNAHQLADW